MIHCRQIWVMGFDLSEVGWAQFEPQIPNNLAIIFPRHPDQVRRCFGTPVSSMIRVSIGP